MVCRNATRAGGGRSEGRTGARRLASLLLIALLWAVGPMPAGAQERLVRRFDATSGLYPTSVHSLAQDRAGFLWVGTQGGLFRYDGGEMRRWAADVIARAVMSLSASPAGGIVALDDAGRLYEIAGADTRTLSPPELAPAAERAPLVSATFDAAGRLWVLRGTSLLRRLPAGTWEVLPDDLLNDETPRLVRPNLWGGVDVATSGGVWELRPTGMANKLADVTRVIDIVPWPDGRRTLLTRAPASVVEVDSSGTRTVLSLDERGIALARRGSTLWISSSRHITAITQDATPRVLGPDVGVEGGGPLLVDREGALWLGTFTGLFEYPEPETRIWTEREGLPSSHMRFLARTGDTIWVTAWQGTGRLERTQRGWESAIVKTWNSFSRLFVDARGDLWTATGNGLLRRASDGTERYLDSRPSELLGHSVGPGGRVWLATDAGLFLVGTKGDSLRHVGDLPFAGGDLDAVLNDSADRLWVAGGDRICGAPAGAVRQESDVSWSCQRIPELRKITSLIELQSGAVWASSGQTGVLRLVSDRWELHPGNDDLPSLAVLNLVRSRSGGIWVLGHGTISRVRERRDLQRGWEIVERVTSWQGVPLTEAGDLLEDPDGGVWITTTRGVVHVPGEARAGPTEAPAVAPVEGWVDDRPIALDGPLELPRSASGIQLRFAALSFRSPSLLRYEVRLAPRQDWSPVKGRPAFRWVDLRPGRYAAEVRASLDGRNWSETPARFSFTVRPPWYREPWALALFALSGAVLLTAAYRARVAYVTGLEQQRTRIAMDLHDDIGSGLGSIGILSGILELDAVAAAARGKLTAEISSTAEELGTALADIVWSLDPRTTTLEDLAARLAQHGERLFSGDDVAFRTEYPAAWPAMHLSLSLRRNLLLVGLEALHNAARHSAARHVLLRFASVDRRWELEVRDDGVGLPQGALENENDGLGLRSMRNRAVEMGAEIRWRSVTGGGTSVLLVFALRRDGAGAARWWIQPGQGIHRNRQQGSVESDDEAAG